MGAEEVGGGTLSALTGPASGLAMYIVLCMCQCRSVSLLQQDDTDLLVVT